MDAIEHNPVPRRARVEAVSSPAPGSIARHDAGGGLRIEPVRAMHSSAPHQVAVDVCELCRSDKAVSVLFTARDWEYGVEGAWVLAECAACRFYWLSPKPTREALAGFYPQTYSAFNEGSVLASLFRLHFWLDARRVARLIGSTGRVLDVGCGAGGWLREMRRQGRWELMGVELNTQAVQQARQAGLTVFEGDLTVTQLQPNSFDLIRMGHVIEHVPDPIETLRCAHALLKPGGVLFAETPNIDCWDFRLFGRYWGALHFPRHLTFFTEQTIRRVCALAGFDRVEIAPRLRTVGWSAAIQNWAADRLALAVPPDGRVPWYPLLIGLCLPLTVLQALVSRPATLALVARKA